MTSSSGHSLAKPGPRFRPSRGSSLHAIHNRPVNEYYGTGSTTSCSLLMAHVSIFWTRPLGHRISTRSTVERFPSPKWTVFEDWDRYPPAGFTWRVRI